MAKLMDERRKTKVVCADLKNLGEDRLKPDLEFYNNNKRYVIDVSFVAENKD